MFNCTLREPVFGEAPAMMPAVEFNPPAPRQDSPGNARPGSASTAFTERFDAVISRALGRAMPESSDDSPAEQRACVKRMNDAPTSEPAPAPDSALAAVVDTTIPPAPAPPRGGASPDPAVAAVASGSDGGEGSGGSLGRAAPTAAPAGSENAGGVTARPPGASVDLTKELQALAGNNLQSGAPRPDGQPLSAGGLMPAAGGEIAAETSDPQGLAPGPPPGSEADGTSAAQQDAGMTKADKTDKVTAPAQQKLPVATSATGAEELSAGSATPVKIKFLQPGDLSGSAHHSGAGSLLDKVESAPAPGAHAVESASPLRSLERTQELMSLQAVRLRESGAESLQVVLQPGPGTQLSLSLKLRDGQVEMSAALNRGDYDLLSRHWPELQQQLETRGIRLAALTCDPSLSGEAGLFQQPDRHEAGEEAVPADGLVDAALVSHLKSTPASPGSVRRGWETWA
jgi:hypothetical protein